MRNHTVRPQDLNAPPSPLLKDVHLFKDGRMSAEDRARVFGGNPYYLRKIVEIATHGAVQAFFDAPSPHTVRSQEQHRTEAECSDKVQDIGA